MRGPCFRRLLVALLAGLVCGLTLASAAAQPTAHDRMMAQALFEDGVRLMEAGTAEEACPKFEESERLDPGIGVRFRLADCYEVSGRLARAWILFVDVAAAARAERQTDRANAARRRAEALEPRLSKLTIDVEEPIAEMVVTHNGKAIGRAQWGTAVPVALGDHVIEARAPGFVPFRKVVQAKREGARLEVVVSPLAELPPPPDDPAVRPVVASAPNTVQYAFAIGLGAVGVVGLAIGTAAGVVAIDKKSDADGYCPQEDACYQKGLTLRDEARDAAAVSTVSFVVGAAALVGGAILWLTADDGEPREAAAVQLVPMWVPGAHDAPDGWGASLIGRF